MDLPLLFYWCDGIDRGERWRGSVGGGGWMDREESVPRSRSSLFVEEKTAEPGQEAARGLIDS